MSPDPKPTRRGVAFWAEDGNGAVLLRKRAEEGLLGGMIEIPSTDWRQAPWTDRQARAFAPVPAAWRRLPGVVRRTLRTVDQATKRRRGDEDDLVLMLGALCHALGRPMDGAARAEPAGIESLLARMRAPKDVVRRVSALVEYCPEPALLVERSAAPRDYRRLSRKLAAAGVTLELLARVAESAYSDAAAKNFLARAQELGVDRSAPLDAVGGRHLVARGFAPGPRFGAMLEQCRHVQDETGWLDAERILDEALTRMGGPARPKP